MPLEFIPAELLLSVLGTVGSGVDVLFNGLQIANVVSVASAVIDFTVQWIVNVTLVFLSVYLSVCLSALSTFGVGVCVGWVLQCVWCGLLCVWWLLFTSPFGMHNCYFLFAMVGAIPVDAGKLVSIGQSAGHDLAGLALWVAHLPSMSPMLGPSSSLTAMGISIGDGHCEILKTSASAPVFGLSGHCMNDLHLLWFWLQVWTHYHGVLFGKTSWSNNSHSFYVNSVENSSHGVMLLMHWFELLDTWSMKRKSWLYYHGHREEALQVVNWTGTHIHPLIIIGWIIADGRFTGPRAPTAAGLTVTMEIKVGAVNMTNPKPLKKIKDGPINSPGLELMVKQGIARLQREKKTEKGAYIIEHSYVEKNILLWAQHVPFHSIGLVLWMHHARLIMRSLPGMYFVLGSSAQAPAAWGLIPLVTTAMIHYSHIFHSLCALADHPDMPRNQISNITASVWNNPSTIDLFLIDGWVGFIRTYHTNKDPVALRDYFSQMVLEADLLGITNDLMHYPGDARRDYAETAAREGGWPLVNSKLGISAGKAAEIFNENYKLNMPAKPDETDRGL